MSIRLLVLCLFVSAFVFGQRHKVYVQIQNEQKKPIEGAIVNISSESKKSDVEGRALFYLEEGKHKMVITSESYQEKEMDIEVSKPLTILVKLLKENILQELVITAKESKGLTTSSIVNRKAMEHLQPSSLTDLMELLPGGLAKDPNLTRSNIVSLRESTGRPSNYITNSLGVQFMIDNNVINTNADLQNSIDNNHMLNAASKRNTVSTGIDMRTISTNDIEKIEIVRGIPSAAYGDLTSGLIKIERKVDKFPLQARFKADGFSKQYYVGKGFSLNKNWQISAGADYLDAKNNPTNNFENYQRMTASFRSKIKSNISENPFEWRANLDISHNLDKEKIDPDTGYAPIDYYKNKVTKLSFHNRFLYELPENYFLNKLVLNSSFGLGIDKIEQVKLVQQSGFRSISLAREQGENVGVFPELTYISHFYTDGKPLDFSLFFKSEGNKKIANTHHQYEIGIDYRYSKNFGKGQIWNPITPPNNGLGIRQRAFNEIPAWQNLAVFLGNHIHFAFGNHKLNMYTGLRLSKLLGVDASYSIHKDILVEPRFNLQYVLPKIFIGESPLKYSVTLGYGEFYKQPTLQMLYPNKRYWDYAQLNYYHNDERYRYVNFMTYVHSVENKNLSAAKNTKKEIRLDFSYKNNELFITFFSEKMDNGFRTVLKHFPHTYKEYDASRIDLRDWNNGPDLSKIPYVVNNHLGSYTQTENGSATWKEGIELGYSSPRIKTINTRFTLRGAWFRTQYRNSVPIVDNKPPVTILGREFPYYGIYKNDTGYINENMNYNLLVDTYLPNLNLNISASLQGSVYDYSKRDKRIAEPISYYGNDGVIHPFTDADRTDLYKQWLIRNVSSTDNIAIRYTHTIMVNLKVTKSIYKGLKTSMFVNRLFNYQHPYYFLNRKIERKQANTPYFGMELNYNF